MEDGRHECKNNPAATRASGESEQGSDVGKRREGHRWRRDERPESRQERASEREDENDER